MIPPVQFSYVPFLCKPPTNKIHLKQTKIKANLPGPKYPAGQFSNGTK